MYSDKELKDLLVISDKSFNAPNRESSLLAQLILDVRQLNETIYDVRNKLNGIFISTLPR